MLLTAQGAYLKLEGGNIELGAPGVVEFKASSKELAGPKSASSQAERLNATYKGCEATAQQAAAGGAAIV